MESVDAWNNAHGERPPLGVIRAVQVAHDESVTAILGATDEAQLERDAELRLLRSMRRAGAWLRDRHRPAHIEAVPIAPSPLTVLDRLPAPHEGSLRRWDEQLRSGDAIAHGPMSLQRMHPTPDDGLDVVVPAEPMRADPALDVGAVLADCAVLLQFGVPDSVPSLPDRMAAAFRSGYDGMMHASPIDELMLRRAIAVSVAAQIEQHPDPDRAGALAADLVENCWRLSA